jgi:hypothetical protein
MLHVGPVLERALVDDCYACRLGKGSLAAVRRAQHHLQRFPWFVKTNIRAYFASIDHHRLGQLLGRRLKDPAVLALCKRILAQRPGPQGRGLPIGALTSQHFANTYLDGFDRFLLEQRKRPSTPIFPPPPPRGRLLPKREESCLHSKSHGSQTRS